MLEQLIGQSLDRYQIVELLGEGGMGGVFRARDVTLQRDVAIKVMHSHYARQPNFQERFLQEARTAARLDHPGIVKVFDFGHSHSLLYIVMEYIPGDSLGKMLDDLRAANEWVPLPEALQLVRQVCLALQYAHRHGILHRDIKPGNIMLKPEASEGLPYRPVLTDLGLAKLLEGGLMTQEGTSMGTPAYMSPEQAMGEPTDARSDVYSLGVLLYELAVGRLPFEIQTLTQAIRAHTSKAPPPPRSLRPDLPEAVERVILTALEKQPGARYADAGSMAEAVAEATGTQPAPAGAATLMTRLQRSQPPGEQPPEAPTGTVIGPSVSPGGDATRRVAAFIENPDLVVDPGGTTTASVTILNQGPVVDHFQVSIVDLPAGWLAAPPPVIRLLPGVQQQVSLVIQPPRSPESRAGVYPLTIHVASQDAPGQLAQVQARLTVRPYLQLESRLKPETVRAGRAAQVVLANRGNAPQTARVTWHDEAQELGFRPPQTEVTVPEGQVVAAGSVAGPRRRRWIGGRKAHPFSVRVSAPGAQPQTLSGEVVSRGLVPAWLPPLAALLLLAVVGLAVVFVARPPVIQSIALDPANPLAGQPVTVRWRVDNAQSIELRPIISGLDPSAGEYTFPGGFPASQDLTFIATNLFGSTNRPLSVIVPTPTPAPAATRAPAATAAAAATATPEATAEADTPTPEPTPTAAPTPCTVAIGSPFATAYASWKARLGCPTALAGETAMAFAPFERGVMFWRQDESTIYVLVSGSAWHKFDDTWEEGQPESDPGLEPPAGLQQPVRGFGKVWREQLGGPAAEIGWAREREVGYAGAWQPFVGGLLLRAPGGQTYALFADGHWASQ